MCPGPAQWEWEGVGGASGWRLKPSGPRKLGWSNMRGILLCLELVLCNPPLNKQFESLSHYNQAKSSKALNGEIIPLWRNTNFHKENTFTPN